MEAVTEYSPRYAVYAKAQLELNRLSRRYARMLRDIETAIAEMREDTVALGFDIETFDSDLGLFACRIKHRQFLAFAGESRRLYILWRTTGRRRSDRSRMPALPSGAVDAVERAQEASDALNRQLFGVWTRVIQSAGFFADAHDGTHTSTYLRATPKTSDSFH